jgi:hypothetical protein
VIGRVMAKLCARVEATESVSTSLKAASARGGMWRASTAIAP